MKGEPYVITREFLMTLLIRVLDDDDEEINMLDKELRKARSFEAALLKEVGELNKIVMELKRCSCWNECKESEISEISHTSGSC